MSKKKKKEDVKHKKHDELVKLTKNKNKKLEKLADKMLKQDEKNQQLKDYDIGKGWLDAF